MFGQFSVSSETLDSHCIELPHIRNRDPFLNIDLKHFYWPSITFVKLHFTLDNSGGNKSAFAYSPTQQNYNREKEKQYVS